MGMSPGITVGSAAPPGGLEAGGTGGARALGHGAAAAVPSPGLCPGGLAATAPWQGAVCGF